MRDECAGENVGADVGMPSLVFVFVFAFALLLTAVYSKCAEMRKVFGGAVGNDRPSPARTDCLSPVRKFHTGEKKNLHSVQELLVLLLVLALDKNH